MNAEGLKGEGVIGALAMRFPQLYVAPAEGAQEAHGLASGYGLAPQKATLNHFVTSPYDELREVQTPAGPVEVAFLKERTDFETFLQIIGHRSLPTPISRTVGAITYRGLADWGKVSEAHKAYLAEGGSNWPDEFARLAKQPGAFRTELVVVSEGPYSNVSASQTPYDEETWLRVSREIRLHHECAHVVCRRTMPDNIVPVWDEVTADVVGLICATKHYNAKLAARFLGVSNSGFADGRLSEYLSEDQARCIDSIACEVNDALVCIEQLSRNADLSHPFNFLLELKHSPILMY